MELLPFSHRTEKYITKTLHKTLGKQQPHAFREREALKTNEAGG
jgi:hypothetical protein